MNISTILPWQVTEFEHWIEALDGARLSHGWLLQGPPGIGKKGFAEAAAASALCESRAAGQLACGHCAGCQLLMAGSHPDLIRIRPALLALAEGVADDDEADEGEAADAGAASDGKKASREIKVQQIRTLGDYAGIASTRGGRRVALIYPAEAMAPVAANALLKTLEEPTPGLVLLLITAAPHRLLPTIRSRCRRLTLPKPSRAAALAWLESQGQRHPDRLDAAGGAPLSVLEQADTAQWATREGLVDALSAGVGIDAPTAARAVESEIKRNDRERQQGKAATFDLGLAVNWLQCFIHDAISQRLAGTVRYHRSTPEKLRATASIPVERLLEYWRWLDNAAAQSRHPVNTLLFLEDCLMRYRGLYLN
ncbi:DNA polymerase III subunit delta' [soil metagenome]